MLKYINIGGILNVTEMYGSNGWYWCCDYASGDLYKAEQLFLHNNPIKSNHLLFVDYPDGQIWILK